MALVGARSGLVLFATAVVVVLAATSAPTCRAAHNITAILSGSRDLAEFSRALTATGLADEINGRNTITVLAVDDARMAPLKARGLPREALRHVLSLHVLVDYYDEAKLRRLPGGSADVSTLFQASGDAPGSVGMVEIADRRGGRVDFAPQQDDGGGDDARGRGAAAAVSYVKSVHQAPYNISVLQVSGVMSSPAADAPASPEPSRLNFSDVMSRNGCGRFAGLIAATAGAAAAFERQAHGHGGLTLFCPADKAVEAFEPTFKNLAGGARLAVVLYHGAVGHYSPQALRAADDDGDGDGMATLASLDGGSSTAGLAVRHAGDKVTLVYATHHAARVTRTLADADPVAVYMIDAVLVPYDLTGKASSPGDVGQYDPDGHSGRKDDGGDGHQTSGAPRGSAPSWSPRGWVAASALVFTTLLAGFASG